jgi:hypothetical protein
MDGDIAKLVLGNDLDDEQIAWCTERLVPESLRLTTEPVSLAGLETSQCTWIRTMLDLILPPEKQLTFTTELRNCDVIDLEAGHMCMVSQPVQLARILNPISRMT